MNYFVYIIKSCVDNGYYVGLTRDIEARLRYHNARKVRSTKSRAPFRLVYSELFPNRASAREREKYLKSYKGSREKLTILENL